MPPPRTRRKRFGRRAARDRYDPSSRTSPAAGAPMPIHDWSRMDDGQFAHFHNGWIYAIADRLNDGLLPPGYYAAGEQKFQNVEPDVLAMLTGGGARGDARFPAPQPPPAGGGVATLAARPPAVAAVQAMPWGEDSYEDREDQVSVRRGSDDRLAAVIEIVSRGNKTSRARLDRFLGKNRDYLNAGIHLLLVDLHPPGSLDPRGLHPALWARVTGRDAAPLGNGATARTLTLASYRVEPPPEAYLQPVRVGDELTDMPLFLTPEHYVPVPLRDTYADRVKHFPPPWRERLEAAD